MQPANKIHIPSLLQFLFSGFGLMLCLLAAPLLFLFGVVTFWQSPSSNTQSYTFFALGWTTLAVGLLVLPSAVLALRRMLRPERKNIVTAEDAEGAENNLKISAISAVQTDWLRQAQPAPMLPEADDGISHDCHFEPRRGEKSGQHNGQISPRFARRNDREGGMLVEGPFPEPVEGDDTGEDINSSASSAISAVQTDWLRQTQPAKLLPEPAEGQKPGSTSSPGGPFPEPVEGDDIGEDINSSAASAISAVQINRLRQAQPANLSQRLSTLLIFLWFPLLVAGQAAAVGKQPWLLLPPLQVLIIGIPLWWLVESGSHGLAPLSAQRRWGLVSVGVLLTPAVIMAAEIFLLGVLALGLGAWLGSQPGMAEELSRLGMRLMNSDLDPEVLMSVLHPFMRRPEVIFGIMTVAAGMLPLLEEALKPLGVWALAWRPLKPAEGFVAGLTCGATFAFIESSGMLSNSFGELWGVMVLARLGTGLLHTACGGLVGWGLANGWYNKGYLRMVLAFLVAAAFHGLWNLFSLTVGIAALLPAGGLAQTLAIIAPLVLGMLMLILFVFITGANRILLRK